MRTLRKPGLNGVDRNSTVELSWHERRFAEAPASQVIEARTDSVMIHGFFPVLHYLAACAATQGEREVRRQPTSADANRFIALFCCQASFPRSDPHYLFALIANTATHWISHVGPTPRRLQAASRLPTMLPCTSILRAETSFGPARVL